MRTILISSLNSLIKSAAALAAKAGLFILAVPLALTTFILIIPTMVLLEEVNRLFHRTA